MVVPAKAKLGVHICCERHPPTPVVVPLTLTPVVVSLTLTPTPVVVPCRAWAPGASEGRARRVCCSYLKVERVMNVIGAMVLGISAHSTFWQLCNAYEVADKINMLGLMCSLDLCCPVRKIYQCTWQIPCSVSLPVFLGVCLLLVCAHENSNTSLRYATGLC